ncbi:MAG: hypothetical protein WB791_11500, partial [Waddliaceae bacterium]
MVDNSEKEKIKPDTIPKNVFDSGIDVFTKEDFSDYLSKGNLQQNDLVGRILEKGYNRLVSNVKTEQLAISLGSNTLIGTMNDKEYDNAPFCSPFNMFCKYPKQRMQSLRIPWLRHGINLSTSLFSLTFKTTKFNQVIQVNNKPCDAIAYPELSSQDVASCIQRLTSQFPHHAIIFPKLDEVTKPSLYQSLVANQFLMVPTRNVHIFHPNQSYLKRSHTKRDFVLLKKQNYTFVSHEEMCTEDLVRMHRLYQMLFIEKHSKENPNLTLQFFQDSHKHIWYTYFALRNADGIIDAFGSYEKQGTLMACGPLGYDTSKDKKMGLYRMIFAQSLKIADQHDYMFNWGGGN